MKTNESQKGYFKTFDGLKLFYSIEGKQSSLPPMFFCYGLVCSKDQWKYQISHFKKTRQIIWLDYRAHKTSEIPQDLSTITIENIAKDISTLFDELKLKEVILLGHSMGVNVALEVARNETERVKALILANGSPKDPLDAIFNSNFAQYGFEYLKQGFYKYPDVLNKLWRIPQKIPFLPEIVSKVGFNDRLVKLGDVKDFIKHATKIEFGVFLQLLDNYTKHNITPWLHEIKQPALLFAGEKDKITPINSQKIMKQLMPNAELYVVTEGSHCPQMDMPDLINLKIEIFLTGPNICAKIF